jgi:spermidine synthase
VWLHLDLIKLLINAISQTYSSVKYAYTTIPSYPSGQIGFIVASKAVPEPAGCKDPVRTPDEATQKVLQYYTPEIHKASFVLPAFAKRAIFDE